MNGLVLAGMALVLGSGQAPARQESGDVPARTPMAAPAPCASTAPLAAGLAGWSTMTPLVAGTTVTDAPTLPIGSGVRLALGEAARVSWAAAPGHVPAPGTRGGIVALTVQAAGRYRVALGAGAWIDLVRDGAALSSVAHGHGPACTPIRKIVEFDLPPGRSLLQLSGTADPTLALIVARVPG